MFATLIRAAYAAEKPEECLYQILVVISKLATLHGINGKEKMQLFKMIGDLSPKYDERFEDIWLELGQIAPVINRPVQSKSGTTTEADVISSAVEKNATWAEYLLAKTTGETVIQPQEIATTSCQAHTSVVETPTLITSITNSKEAANATTPSRKRSRTASETHRSSKRLANQGPSFETPSIWSDKDSSDDENDITHEATCPDVTDESLLTREKEIADTAPVDADPLFQLDPIEIKLEQFESDHLYHNIEVAEALETTTKLLPITPVVRFSPDLNEKRTKRQFKSIESALKDIRKENAKIRSILMRVLTENAELKTTLEGIESDQLMRHNVIHKAVQYLITTNGRGPTTVNTSNIVQRTDFDEPSWPLVTCQSIVDINTKLKDLPYRDQLFSRLVDWRLVLPDDIRKTVKKIMERMFSYDVLIQFSWSGKTSIDSPSTRKLQFVEMANIVVLIMDVIGCASYAIVESEIKYFMKRVPQNYKAFTLKGSS